jgi:effector-binding domain-containing protein
MHAEIITQRFERNLLGFGGIAANKNYAATAFKLSGRTWETVRANGIKNKGMNIWVYEAGDKVFAGLEPDNLSAGDDCELEKKTVVLEKYAYYKYVGPYDRIKQTGEVLIKELTKQGFEVTLPYIEIYGHWTADENKSETELFMCLK